jgi:hypothetical protein
LLIPLARFAAALESTRSENPRSEVADENLPILLR